MSDITFTAAHHRAIKAFASKVLRRAKAGGAQSLMFADIYQELCIAWCRARDSWKAEFGVPFGAYLVRGMQLHVNRWVQGEITHGHAESLDVSPPDIGLQVHGHGGRGYADAYGAVADKTEGQDELLERQDFKEFVMERLTPRTRLYVRLLDSPPQFLLDAIDQYQAHKKVARDHDRQFAAPVGVTSSMVLDFMEAPRQERAKIYAELARVAERII